MTRNRVSQALLGVAALIGTTLAGVVTAAPAAADECIYDCGAAAFEEHTETPPDPFYGEAVTFSAWVRDDNAECNLQLPGPVCDPPTGDVEWYDGDATEPFLSAPLEPYTGTYHDAYSSTPDEGFVYAGLAGGAHTIKMKYVPGEHEPADDEFDFTVYPRPTETTVNVSDGYVGQTVTMTATVEFEGQIDEAHGAQRPAGLVEFHSSGVSLGTAPVSNGAAQISVPLTNPGRNSVLAQYLGDGNYDGSVSLPKEYAVAKGDTTTDLTQSSNTTVFGESFNYSVTPHPVAPATGQPHGALSLYADGQPIAGTLGLALNGQYSALTVGEHQLYANFGGDDNFNPSTSVLTSHTVTKADTLTTLAATTPNPSNVGDSVTLSASVTVVAPGAGTPTGSVQFLEGTTALGTAPLGGSTTTLQVSGLSGGAHPITARYLGDGNLNPSTSAPRTHTLRCDVVMNTNLDSSYTAAPGRTTCIVNATINGSVTVPAGARVSIVNATIGGLVGRDGSSALIVCGSSVKSVSVPGSNGTVVIGSPGTGCAGNSIGSGVQLLANRAGLRFDSNRIGSGVQVKDTTGGPTIIRANTISGSLQCSGNNPVATNGGLSNTASSRSGECAAANF